MSGATDPQLDSTLAMVHCLAYAASRLPREATERFVQASRQQARQYEQRLSVESGIRLDSLLDQFEHLIHRFAIGDLS